MQRVTFGLVCLSFLCLSAAAHAQDASSPIPETSAGAVQDFSGGGILDTGGLLGGTYVDVRHVIGDGVGYRNSYSQIGGFLPIWMTEDSLIAPNARFILTNSTQTGVNVGLVGRQYMEQYDRLIGLYGYYDNDQNFRNFRYQQFTVGAETLGTWWDLRANGYFLNGNQSNFVSAISLTGDPYYVGHLIAIQGRQLRDQALGGVDVELGVPLSPQTPWLRGYGGAYGYRHDGGNTVGYRGRLEANVASDLSLGMMVTYDALFGTNINGTIEFKFSGFKPTVYFPQLTTRQRMTSSVQRNWRIATRTYVGTTDIATIDPATQKPYFVTHVSAGAQNGDGTFEHPFGALPTSAPGEIILVHNGISSYANPTTGHITLSDNQRLLGDGYPSLVYLQASYGGSNISGNYQLPGTTSSYQYPFVGGDAGSNIVTLANNNEVAGLSFVKADRTAITNLATGSHNFNLHHINVQNSGLYGISLQNASGLGNISFVNADQNLNMNGGIGDNKSGGIQIATGAGGLTLHMSDVYMKATTTSNQAFGVQLTANTGDLNVSMNNVFADQNMTGIQLIETGRYLRALMNINPDGTNNLGTTVTASLNQGAGFDIQGNGGTIDIRGSTLDARSNGSDNVRITTNNTNLNMGVSNSLFSGSGGSGVVLTQSQGNSVLTLDKVQIFNNQDNGVGVFSSNGAKTQVYVFDSSVAGNTDGFHAEATTGADIAFVIDPTYAIGNTNDGFFFRADGVGSSIYANLESVALDASGRSAIHGESLNRAHVTLFANNFTGMNSGGDGFFLNVMGGSSGLVNMTNGALNNSGVNSIGKAAMNINVTQSNLIMYTDNVTGQQTVAGTQGFGLKLNVVDAAMFDGTIRNGDFSDTRMDAININVADGVAGGSFMQLELAGTHNDRSYGDGLNATVGTNSQAFLSMVDDVLGNTVRHTTFDDNDHNGLNFNVTAGHLEVTSQNASFSRNGLPKPGLRGGVDGSGVLGQVSDGGSARLVFGNTTINNNFDNGVSVTATKVGSNVSNVFMNFMGGSVSQNGAPQNPILTARGNNGIRLLLDGADNSFLGMSGGTNVSGNGNDGLLVLAQNGSTLNSVIDGAVFTNNGATPDTASPLYIGAGIDVVNDKSTVVMDLNNVTSGNTAGNTTQQTGLQVITTDSTAASIIGATNVSMTNNVTGFLAATDGGHLTAGFNGGNLSNNSADAVNNFVTGTGSTADIGFDGTVGNGSGNIGAIFNTTAGAVLNVNSVNGTSFSNSGGTGLFSNVDGLGSQANFGLTNIQMLNNGTSGFGGQGLLGVVTGGATMNAVIFNSSISADSLQGMELIVDGTGSVANFHVEGTVVDSNSSEGLLILATNSADVNYRSVNSSYNNNGSNGSLDGVSISADNAKVLSLFSGGSIDGNAGNGLNLSATNGAYMTTTLDNISISNNALYGIQTLATGGGTTFNLLMSGTNTLTGNGLGSYSPFNFANINQAVIAITAGSNDNRVGDGLSATFNNLTNAVFALTGPGTADNNSGNGINVQMDTITGHGSVLIDGMTSISHNGQNGILIGFNNVTQGSIGISGPTSVMGNTNDGISIDLNASPLVDNLTFGATGTVEMLTLVNNLPSPLNNQLPVPVTAKIDDLGLVPQTALTINAMTITSSGDTGINIHSVASPIGTLTVSNNLIANTSGNTLNTGDGIHFDLNSAVTALNITGNAVGGAARHGVNIDLNTAPVGSVNIANNSIGDLTGFGSAVADSLPLIIPGLDASSLGAFDDIGSIQTALGFNINYFGAQYSDVWVNNNGNITFDDKEETFTPFNLLTTNERIVAPFFADVDTRTGNTATYGTGTVGGHKAFAVNWIDVRHYNSAGGGTDGLPTNTFQVVLIDRSDITPGDFDFEFNYGNVAWESGQASGGDAQGLGGFSARAGYSNGTTTFYELPGSAVNGAFLDSGPAATALVHNSLNSIHDGRYVFNVRGGLVLGVLPNAGDGIRLNAMNNSNIASFNATSNTITKAGQDGIEILLTNSNLTNPNFTTNNIHDNTRDGIRMVNPTTTATSIAPTFTGNTISTNGGIGVNLNLATQDLKSVFTNNTISGNTGGAGVNIQMGTNHSVLAGSNFTGNTITNNAAQGVNFAMANGGFVSGNFTNNTISNNTAEGVRYAMGANGVNPANVTTTYSGNTINQNGAQGVNFLMGPTLPVAGQSYGTLTANFTNNTINQNTAEGINITLDQGTGVGQGADFIGNTFYGNTISNNGNMGIRLTANANTTFNWTLGDTTKNANTFSANKNAGVGVTMTGASIGTFNIAKSIFANTTAGSDVQFGGEGLRVNQSGQSDLHGSMIASQFTSNAGDGAMFKVDGNTPIGPGLESAILHDFSIGGSLANQNTFTNNGGNGLEFFRLANGRIQNINIGFNKLDSNTRNGLAITAQARQIEDTYNINNNTMLTNGLNGVLYSVKANGQVLANMDSNTIQNNGTNGIQLVEELNAPSDQRHLNGLWTNNTITNNTQDGIALNGATVGLVIGAPGNANTISDNKENGIEVTGPGSLTIASNAIQRNGTLSNLGTQNENAGVMMNVAWISNITVQNNLITDNFGDGIQYGMNTAFADDVRTSGINILNNMVLNNDGRGVDVINRGNNITNADISGNTIAGNLLEGLYVINTSAQTQNQWSSSTDPLAISQSILEDPELRLRVVGNQIIGNGANSNLAGTGFVLRVGTSDARDTPPQLGAGGAESDTGGFASLGTSGGIISQGVSAGTFFSNITQDRGGVIAQVDNNIVTGNFGNDIEFHSFVSTRDPVTNGTWAAPPANQTITSYESDPLSRLDIYFRGNSTDPGALDSLGFDLGGYTNRQPGLVAFYNNAEATFKSRPQDTANPANTNDGPFTSATRARNATRQALFSPAQPADGSNIYNVLYPGMGVSTWRASSNSQAALTGQTENFPVPLFGELPYVWNTADY